MTIDQLRNKIDAIDAEMIQLFESRMKIVKDIGELKKRNQLNVLDQNREAQVISKVVSRLQNKTLEPYVIQLFETLMNVSKDYQK
ncbi:MAG: chorismate mutase [Acholeplasmataceae bacterium]|jgi:monofunctional chorismate mutase